MPTFPGYLREIAKTFPSKKAMAAAIGISAPRLSRALKGEGNYSFNVENCLRLAKAANRPQGEVLRAAAKSDVADLLDFLLPEAGRPQMTADQRLILYHFESITKEERAAYRVLLSHRRRQTRSSGS